MPRFAKARDANEPEIRDALIAAISIIEGVTERKKQQALVIRIDQPCDLLVGIGEETTLLEVKNPAQRGAGGSRSNRVTASERAAGGQFEGMDPRLTRSQALTHQAWRGSRIHIVETIKQAAMVCGICTCCYRRVAVCSTGCEECDRALSACEELP